MKNIKKSPEETLLCILEAIDRKNKLTPELSPEDKKIQKRVAKMVEEAGRDIVSDTEYHKKRSFHSLKGKRVELFLSDMQACDIMSLKELEKALGILKQGNLIFDFALSSKAQGCIEVLLSKSFEEPFQKFKEKNKKREIKQGRIASQASVFTASPEASGVIDSNEPKKRKPRIPLTFPEPVQWGKVTIKIKEGRQEIEIFYDKGHIITADYIQLGFFVGKKHPKPDRQWGFLCALAVLVATDIRQAKAESMRTMIAQGETLSINNVHQAKKSLVWELKDIFKTSENPFHDKREYYEPKFTLSPEPILRREEVWPQGGRLNENRPYEDNEEEAF